MIKHTGLGTLGFHVFSWRAACTRDVHSSNTPCPRLSTRDLTVIACTGGGDQVLLLRAWDHHEHIHPRLWQGNISALDLRGGEPGQGTPGQTEHKQLQMGLMLGRVTVWGQTVELALDPNWVLGGGQVMAIPGHMQPGQDRLKHADPELLGHSRAVSAHASPHSAPPHTPRHLYDPDVPSPGEPRSSLAAHDTDPSPHLPSSWEGESPQPALLTLHKDKVRVLRPWPSSRAKWRCVLLAASHKQHSLLETQ